MILSKNDSHHAMMTTTNNNNQSIDPDTNRSRQSYRFLKKKKSHFIIVAFKYSVKTIASGCYICFDSASLPDQIICQNMIFKCQNILDTT